VAVSVTLPVLLLFVCGDPAVSQKKTGADKTDKQVVDSKARKHVPATSINFKKALNLPFKSLGTLGARIEAARRAPDPVALAHAANELFIAERVSNKKAALTADQVADEAGELANMRRQASELKAMILQTTQLGKEKAQIEDLKRALAAAQKQARQETQAVKNGKEPSAAFRKVLVNNGSTQYVDIYVNGNLKTQIPPGESKWFVVEHKWNPTVLTAWGNADESKWGPRYIWGKFVTYTWNIY
jgi:hypothetical protein